MKALPIYISFTITSILYIIIINCYFQLFPLFAVFPVNLFFIKFDPQSFAFGSFLHDNAERDLELEQELGAYDEEFDCVSMLKSNRSVNRF